jgi:hypothetical protein
MTLYYPVQAQLTKPNIQRTYAFNVEHFWDWDVVQ